MIKRVLARALSNNDWWFLKSKVLEYGHNSIWGMAYHINNERGHYFIGETACIQEKPILPHGTAGIYISGGASIGKNCTILQQVTIGSNTLEGSKGNGYPTIGNNVYIGAGAKIIGNVVVGDNCRIGANAVVVENVPANSTVVLNKCRIIKNAE